MGHHRFVIETTDDPQGDLAAPIDNSLAAQNADYRTKRINDIVISPPEVHTVPNGTFEVWMAANGHAGGQRKVPRVTTPERLDEINQTPLSRQTEGPPDPSGTA